MVCGRWWLNLERPQQADNMVLWVSNELSWLACIGQSKRVKRELMICHIKLKPLWKFLKVIQYPEIHFILQAHNMQ